MSIHRVETKTGTKYQVKLRRPDGTQYSRTFRTKREAVKFENTERVDRSRGSWIDDRRSKVTFDEYAQKWMDSNPGKRNRSKQRDRGILDKYILPVIGSRPIREIRHSDIQSLVNTWTTRGLSPASVTRQKAVVSAVFRLALRDEAILRSPVDGIKTPRIEPSTGRALTAVEAARLLASIDARYQVPAYILMTTGLRWSELAGLDVRHFSPLSSPPSLQVRQGAHETSGGVEVTPTKSAAGHRTIPLAQEQVEAISWYLAQSERTAARGDEPLFLSPSGRRLRHSNFNPRVWLPATKQAGLDGLRIHDLRKTAITNLVRAGIDLKTVTVLVGHEDVRTTLRHYAKASSESLLEASQALVEAVRLQSGQIGEQSA